MDFVPSRLRSTYPLMTREAGTGFASRLAALNGRPMRELFQHMRIPPFAVDHGAKDAIGMVAELGGIDPVALIHQTPVKIKDKREYHVAGEVLGPLGISRTFFRFCPHCMLDDLQAFHGPRHARPWLRIEWLVTHYRSCHLHGMPLVAAEPERRRFQPFDFSETVTTILPNLDSLAEASDILASSAFERWIVARLDGTKDPANWLDRLPLYVAASWCEALGVSMLHSPKVATSELSEREWATAAEEGFRISAAGADSIRGALDQMTAREKRTRGIIGPRDTYGYAYHLLQKTFDDQAFVPIRDLVRDHVFDALPWKIGDDVLGRKVEANRLLTVRTAALEAGADRKTMRKLFQKKGIATDDIRAGLRNHRVMVDAEEIQPVLNKLKGAMTLPAVMKHLGIERRQVEALVDAGALPCAMGVERGSFEQHRFAPDDVGSMMASLMDGAVEVTEPTDRQVDIPTARHMAGATTVDVLKLIFARRLGWKGRLAGRNNYMALLVDADEVTALVRQDAPQFTNLRFCDVETVVPGLSQRSIQPLIDLGQLVETMEYSPNARREVRVVTAASVGAFQVKYVTAAELCQTYGLHHKQVKYRLLDAGVDMAFDQEVVKAMIYGRAKVERVSPTCFSD